MNTPAELQLSHGALTFSALEVGSGPTVILMHGFPDTLHTWRQQMMGLADRGYRAIAVAMRGYEPGSQPENGDYSIEALAGDVAAWIGQLDVEQVHLVGHDWGASVAYAAGVAIPDRLLSLTTLSVPHSGRFLTELHRHPRQLRLSWYMLFFQLRGVSDYVVRRNHFSFLRRLWRDWSPHWQFSDEEFERVVKAFSEPGVVRGALAYYRAALDPRTLPLRQADREAYRWRINVPTLGITGVDEGCIASDVFRSLMYPEDFPAGLRVVEVQGAGHFPHLEKPAEVGDLLVDWLDSHNK